MAACLLACCLLDAAAAAAAAKLGRSTLDTKKGYKTKTGSTSSVTLTLTRIEYWDRDAGERNITFKAFCDFRRAKIAYNGLKMGSFRLFVHPKQSSHHFGKKVFDPFLTHFWSPKSPFSRLFGNFGGSKRATMGSKRTKNTCLSTPSGLGKNLEKIILDHFWTHI